MTAPHSYALAVARFYDELADRLQTGAEQALRASGEVSVDVFEVPGAFEMPTVAKYLAESGRYRGIVCLGAVIRGETSHYDYVCNESARGIVEVSLATGVPCGYGILTCENYEQALARCGEGKRDSGAKAAQAMLALADIRDSLAA